MSFEKHSNFNKLANFSEVKFGENKPVLEVELNEMQQIQNEARADIIRDTMPSGFVTLGDIDYDYCANNDNQIKLKTESIAYVNGYRITIPKDTIIEIGEADKIREDLVFLEVWKEAVNDIDTLTEYGGENNAVINNPIKDSRYPVATSQRVALKYRIRHVADIDFNTYVLDGFTKDTHSVSGFVQNNQQVLAIGGLSDETSLDSNYRRFFNYKQRSHYKSINGGNNVPFEGSTDVGLFVAGNERDKTLLNTSDGYVYAIPMFRLKRKPHVGLASPFEYKKIHNQLDPKKFAHLVGQENVEKAHSVDIKGKTYKNLNSVVEDSYVTTAGNGTGVNRSIIKPNHYRWSRDSGNNVFFPKLGLINSSFSPNTVYTIQYTIESNIDCGHGFCIAYGDAYVGKSTPDVFYNEAINYSTPKATIKRVFTTRTPTSNTSNEICIGFSGIRTSNPCWCEISNLIILEGDYSHVEDLTLLPGIQSLGENTNNSITVENNLVEEGTYVHELQNHILPTHPEVTHVTWGEDVVIPPEVEIELKNGEEVVQTITQLPVKLETTGEEKLHVKTMKGRTLVNLATRPLKTVTATNSWQPLSPISLVSGKKYLAIFHVESNTLNSTIKDVFKSDDGSDTAWGIDIVPAGKVGTFKRTFVAPFDTKNYHIYSDSSSQGSATVKCVLLEYVEGMENWDLKYFKDMQSVKMPVLTTTGKNLFDKDNVNHISAFISSNKTIVSTNNVKTYYIKCKSNTNYTISKIKSNYFRFASTNSEPIEGSSITTFVASDTKTSLTITTGLSDNYLCFNIHDISVASDITEEEILNSIQIEEGSQATPYEPYKSNILRTPSDLELRGIGEVQDTLDLLTGEVTERIGEIVLDGSENYWYFREINENTVRVTNDNLFNSSTVFGINDKLYQCNQEYQGLNDVECLCIRTDKTGVGIRVSKQKVSPLDSNGFRQWLSQNPITVQYQLATPITEKIGLSEDDYVGKSKVTYQLAEPLRKVGTYSDFIKGETLYSNIGVEVFDGSEEWARQSGTDYGFYFNHPNSMPSTPLISPQLPTLNGWENYARKGIFRGAGAIGLVVSADDLSENTLQGFKNWLKANPVTIYYVKANPVEIPLKEVSPLECDFSYYRQFKRGYENYLKELPNGVKDVVENGKVKRNVGLVSLGDFELDKWRIEFSNEKYIAFDLLGFGSTIENPYASDYRFSNVLPYITHDQYLQANTEGLRSSSIPALVISKSRLTTPDTPGLVKWLKSNNVSMMYQLKEPTTEALTEENKRYVPYMPLNSYVGSLYVADGINRTKFLTDFSPSEYEVQTSHRYFSNEFNMFEDIKRKKSPYGHKTYLEEVDGKYVEKFIAGLEKHEIEDLRHKVSLTGFDYSQLLQDSFLKLIKGELS